MAKVKTLIATNPSNQRIFRRLLCVSFYPMRERLANEEYLSEFIEPALSRGRLNAKCFDWVEDTLVELVPRNYSEIAKTERAQLNNTTIYPSYFKHLYGGMPTIIPKLMKRGVSFEREGVKIQSGTQFQVPHYPMMNAPVGVYITRYLQS